MKHIHKIILAIFVGIAVIALVTAFQLQTVYNPFTGKLDYIVTSNFSGDNVTADYFFGNGSQLTGIEGEAESDPIWTADKSDYSTTAEILAFGYYNSTDFVITDYFTKSDVIGFGYYNATDFDIANYFTSAEVLAFNYYNSSNFDITDYFTSAQILGFDYYNSTDFSISDYYTKTQINDFDYYNLTDFDIANYYLKSNPFSFYNSTIFDYNDYYLKNNPFGFYNSTNPQTETDPIFTAWDNFTGIPHATPSNGDVTHFSWADEIYDWVIGLGYTSNTGTVTSIATTAPISGGTITTTGTISLATATPSDGDTTHASTADQIFDWVTGLGYLTSVAYNDLTGNPSDRITAGSHISWTGNTLNVADDWWNAYSDFMGTTTTNKWCIWDGSQIDCNVNPVTDTTYSASGTLLDLTGTTFSVNAGTLTTTKGCKFVTGTGIVCDQDYLTSVVWTDLSGYPVACPANTYITQLNDSVTCTAISDVYLLNTGDTASGTYNFDSNTLVVDSTTHRVGIGTASPAYNLHVWNAGGTGVKTTVSVKQEDDGAGHAGALAQLESSGWSEAYVRLGGHYIGATVGDMKYYVASGDHYFANGNVGIGTPAPDNILEVHSTAATKGIDISSTANNPVLNLRIDNDGASYTAGIYFSGWNASSVDTNLARISSYQTANAASGDLRFYTADGGVFTEAIRIDKDGNVGIGTASPGYLLEVDGTFQADDYYSGDGTQGITTTFDFVESLCYNATGSLFPQSKTVTVKDGLITSIGHLGSPSTPGVCPV